MSETTVDIETPDGPMPLFEAAPVDPVARGAVIVVLADLGATLAQLRRKGFADRGIGAVGFCVGGRFAFLAAAQWRLAAAVTFYGGGIVTARSPRLPSLIDRAASLRTPWLGLFGDRDTVIPVEDVERLRAAVAGHLFRPRSTDTQKPGTASMVTSGPASMRARPSTGGRGR